MPIQASFTVVMLTAMLLFLQGMAGELVASEMKDIEVLPKQEKLPVSKKLSPEDTTLKDAQRHKAEQIKNLKQIDKDKESARKREQKIQKEIESLERDHAKLNETLVLTADHLYLLEGRVEASEKRLVRLGENEKLLTNSFLERRKILAVLLGAMQRLGGSPPPALIVSPGDAVRSVRSAILLGAAFPTIRNEATALAADLDALQATRANITTERHALIDQQNNLAKEQIRLKLLIKEKQKLRKVTERSLKKESEKATLLAQKSLNLKELILTLEHQIETARLAAEAARKAAQAQHEKLEREKAETLKRKAKKAAENGEAKLAHLGDPGRITPLIPFSQAVGLLRQPVRGIEIRTFDDDNGMGGKTQGVSLATRGGARVISPSDGWVVYAGPFRSYGQILILNVGEGYHILLAGMEQINVELGQFVLTGEPVAEMGQHLVASVASPNIQSVGPVLYVEFRKNGNSIDPDPWWINNKEKVRG